MMRYRADIRDREVIRAGRSRDSLARRQVQREDMKEKI